MSVAMVVVLSVTYALAGAELFRDVCLLCLAVTVLDIRHSCYANNRHDDEDDDGYQILFEIPDDEDEDDNL
jgi:hypothetical protein